ncbi:MAG TPA: hypothetical protein VFS43_13500 [Polyangiaceae bacterium]|nr:hypothetical protein [Polyangiaceae bacterium]
MNEHVSSFELDVHFVEPDPRVAAHVASCPRCRAYLEGLEALAPPREERSPRALAGLAPGREGPSAPAPEAPAPPRAGPPRPAHGPAPAAGARARLRLVAPAAGALALAAALALYWRGRPAEEADYVGAKGSPAVQLLVRAGGTTKVWDGRTPLRPGDAIAVHVACEWLEHATVAADAPSGLARLSDGPCPKGPSPLPLTLVVDAQPGRERFSVVLAKRRLGDAELRERVRANARDRDVWVTSFDLPKETP